MALTLLWLVVALAFVAFFTGMEVASGYADRLRLEVGRKSGVASRILSLFFRYSHDLASTLLVGNCIALIAYGVLVAYLAYAYFLPEVEGVDVWVLGGVSALAAGAAVLLLGEFLPRALFRINPDFMLRFFAVPLYVCYLVLFPVARLVSGGARLFLRLFGIKTTSEETGRAFGKIDLGNFVQAGIESAGNEENLDTEVRIFQNALDFSNVKIRDCFVPRTEVVGVGLDATLSELKDLFVEKGLSRIIVYDGDIDHVAGYIHSSEMFRNPSDWHKGIKDIPIVPETMSASRLMQLFMQQKKTMAVVVDEFGGTTGIVTLEDLVEEILGDIEDEHDNVSYVCKRLNEHEYLLSGRLEIAKVNEQFGLELPESDDYHTVGGLILEYYQSLPKAHEQISIGRYQFKIVKVTATKIELVRLKMLGDAL